MKRLGSIVIMLLFAVSCSTEESDSPLFLPGQIVTIKGQYLNSDGSPLAGAKIQLQNLRRFGYIDYTQATIDSLVDTFITIVFFPFYDIGFGRDDDDYERPASYFLSDVVTDSNGVFQFNIVNDKFVRDADGGINLVLINDDQASTGYFGKYNLVIKDQETDLGTNRLCGQELTFVENEDSVTVGFEPLADAVAKYVINIGDARDRSLIWSQDIANTESSIELPKSVFGSGESLVAIEGFYRLEETLTSACLFPPQVYQVESPKLSIANGQLAKADGIEFKVDSLTNSQFSDPIYFEAFGTSYIELDLPTNSSISKVVLHNLKLESAGNLQLTGLIDNSAVDVDLGSFAEQRFMVIDLGKENIVDGLQIQFSSGLADLQEISVH